MADKKKIIAEINNYPREKYNVLIPVTTIEALSEMQKVTIKIVELDCNLANDGKPTGHDIYRERNGEYAPTKVGCSKLAAAAGISIVGSTKYSLPSGCERCLQVAKVTGNNPNCSPCQGKFSARASVTIRIPEPSGGFRFLEESKEIDCTIEQARMKPNQYNEFLPNVKALAESKAFLRAVRNALGLPGTYKLNDIKKPFVIARVVPDLDHPALKQLAAAHMLESIGMMFAPTSDSSLLPSPEDTDITVPELPDIPSDDTDIPDLEALPEPVDLEPSPMCSVCGIVLIASNGYTPEGIADYTRQHYGAVMCPDCMRKEHARRRTIANEGGQK